MWEGFAHNDAGAAGEPADYVPTTEGAEPTAYGVSLALILQLLLVERLALPHGGRSRLGATGSALG